MKNILFSAILPFFIAAPAFSQTNQSPNIVVGGDPLPDQLNSQYQILCGKDRVYIQMHTDSGNSSILTDIVVNGRNLVNNPFFSEFKQFVSTINFPYLSGAACPSDQFSFVISGIPRSGSDTFFRVTFPRGIEKLDKK